MTATSGLILGLFAVFAGTYGSIVGAGGGFLIVPALLLFGLLSGAITFWFSPLVHFWSRRYEYQADAYAAATTGQIDSLIGALRKLNEKNLSNLTPHPLFSGFYYSHPTLLERERALRAT